MTPVLKSLLNVNFVTKESFQIKNLIVICTFKNRMYIL